MSADGIEPRDTMASIGHERNYYRKRLRDAFHAWKLKATDRMEESLDAECPHSVPWCSDCAECLVDQGKTLGELCAMFGEGDRKKGHVALIKHLRGLATRETTKEPKPWPNPLP